MRSRYTAYTLGRHQYLVDTTHPDYRDDLSVEKLAEQADKVHWLRLEMGDCTDNVPAGEKGELFDVVEFHAFYELEGTARQIGERSFFQRKDDVLYYVDGTALRPESYRRESAKVGRNDPCPCGSGKKYKKCCGSAEA